MGCPALKIPYMLRFDDRLKTISVEVARSQGEEAYISQGLKPGDKVITTRVIDPMENTRADNSIKERL